jgi:peroxidase
VVAHKVLFTSDAALTRNFTSNNLVRAYADLVPYLWQHKFAKAMVKMGGVEVKTAANGEIRKTCHKSNSRP